MNNQQTEILDDILIVDDNPINLRLLSRMLSTQGYKVRAVSNGPRAIESAQTTPPDLILLDVNMPDMNGYQVCLHLKANERTCTIPIIFISALDQTEDKVQAFAVGGVDYITKPFQFEEVVARVETHLSLRHIQKHLEKLVEAKVNELELADTNQLTSLGMATSGMTRELKQLLTTITSDTDHLKTIIQQADDKHTGKTKNSSAKTHLMNELYQVGESLEQNVAQCRQIIDHLLNLNLDSKAAS
ncbi:MAG: response regulator [Chloroflexi bacterium]|nr:response regulator [Chloroflexota bacterium]